MKTRFEAPRTPMGKAAQALLNKRRQEAVAMLESCGVSPQDVPLDVDMRREGTHVRLERFVRHPQTGQVMFSVRDLSDRLMEFSIQPKVIPDWIPSD